MAEAATHPNLKQRTLWAYVPAVLLLAMLAGLAWLAAIAIDDPSFAVEKDYYQKAVGFDGELEQQQQNAALGWQAELRLVGVSDERTELEVLLRDRAGAPIRDARVAVEAFPNARAEQRVVLQLATADAGSYRASFAAARRGLWEFRVRAVRGAERYTQVMRQDLPVRSTP